MSLYKDRSREERIKKAKDFARAVREIRNSDILREASQNAFLPVVNTVMKFNYFCQSIGGYTEEENGITTCVIEANDTDAYTELMNFVKFINQHKPNFPMKIIKGIYKKRWFGRKQLVSYTMIGYNPYSEYILIERKGSLGEYRLGSPVIGQQRINEEPIMLSGGITGTVKVGAFWNSYRGSYNILYKYRIGIPVSYIKDEQEFRNILYVISNELKDSITDAVKGLFSGG